MQPTVLIYFNFRWQFLFKEHQGNTFQLKKITVSAAIGIILLFTDENQYSGYQNFCFCFSWQIECIATNWKTVNNLAISLWLKYVIWPLLKKLTSQICANYLAYNRNSCLDAWYLFIMYVSEDSVPLSSIHTNLCNNVFWIWGNFCMCFWFLLFLCGCLIV